MQELRDKIISHAHIRFLNGGINWLNLLETDGVLRVIDHAISNLEE
jgi:hypothetical protein